MAAAQRLREASAALRRVYRATLAEARALDGVPVLQCLVEDDAWEALRPALEAGAPALGGGGVPERAYQSPWTMREHVRAAWRAGVRAGVQPPPAGAGAGDGAGDAPGAPGGPGGPDAAVRGLEALRGARVLAQRLGALPWRGVAPSAEGHDVFEAYRRAKRTGRLMDPGAGAGAGAGAGEGEGAGGVLEGLVADGSAGEGEDALLVRALGAETDATRAVGLLRESVAAKETAVARFMLGFVALEAGQYGEAVRELRRALVLDPGLGSAWHELGMAVLKAPLADGERAETRADEARRCFRHARASPRMVRGERKRPTLVLLELIATASQARASDDPAHVDDHAEVAREILWLLLAAAEEDPADVEYLRTALLRRCRALEGAPGGR